MVDVLHHAHDDGTPRAFGAARPVSRAVGGALHFIETSFAQPVSLDTLASVAGLSVSRFATRFRSEVGVSPHRYLCLVRIRRAQDLLRAGLPPSVVATEVGFFDQSHLCRHFRRVLGLTPRDYVERPGVTRDVSGTAERAGRRTPERAEPVVCHAGR
ncbi:AraC family transcriptional regulator [Burkholderia sp. Ac-20353]|uniref:helix-turn-helix domain-containing protein n=1 Tax=Burkholderia sp. Ac-20353 TaxID=2703894 RepID=UPI00197B7A11|nr:AraC family transcriptional regulator [Burkholderia sp. Ac-20353]MBN3791539.1 helix-turn-helix transcriptional regulator [Burkholderia sp. Ac-20353]